MEDLLDLVVESLPLREVRDRPSLGEEVVHRGVVEECRPTLAFVVRIQPLPEEIRVWPDLRRTQGKFVIPSYVDFVKPRGVVSGPQGHRDADCGELLLDDLCLHI